MNLQTAWISFGSGNPFTGYLAKPAAGVESMPAVIVLQEIWGVDPHIQSVTERFAMAGYVALAPDLFALNGQRPAPLTAERIEQFQAFRDSLPAGAFGNQEAMAQVLAEKPEAKRNELQETMAAIFHADFPAYLERITAAAAYLREQEPTSKGRKVASVGYCRGGALSAQLACLDPQLAGAVVYYGDAPKPEQLVNIACPVMGFYGGNDTRITDAVPAFADAMKDAGKSFVAHVYPGAPHAFFNDTRTSYHAAASRDSFSRTLAFLNEQLS